MRRGASTQRCPAAAGLVERCPLLGATWPAQSSVFIQRPPPQSAAGPRGRPQAASWSGEGFRGRASRRACSVVRAVPEGLSRLTDFVLFFERGRLLFSKRNGESKVEFEGLRGSAAA